MPLNSTTHFGLPLETHGNIPLRETVDKGFQMIDAKLKELDDATAVPAFTLADVGKAVTVINDGGVAKTALITIA